MHFVNKYLMILWCTEVINPKIYNVMEFIKLVILFENMIIFYGKQKIMSWQPAACNVYTSKIIWAF